MAIYDSNNKEIRTGDIVTISGAYFKSSNGLFFVEHGPDFPDSRGSDLWLRRIKKNGELTVNNAKSVESWPLRSYCSDRVKNREARLHNEQNAKITVTEGVNTFHAAAWFREKSNDNRERAQDLSLRWGADRDDVRSLLASGDFYAAVADRLSEKAEQPKAKEPETGIRFYWNGIKVDGGRLISCFYSIDDRDGSVSITARDYKDLPTKYFVVENNTDIMTDYFDDDRTTLTPAHPLYRFAHYAAWKARCREQKSYIEHLRERLNSPERWRGDHDSARQEIERREKWLSTFAAMKDPGQPTSADLAAVEDLKTAAESARKAREHAEALAAREEQLRKISEGRHYAEQIASEHPVVEGQPTVEIGFSESPYLYSFHHGADNVFSVAAAEIILGHFDELHHAEQRGYEKTDFTIRWTDEKTGEAMTYEGRYDLGDNDGGLIEHIRAFGNSTMHDEQEKADILALADHLETFTEGGRVVSVDLAPGLIDLMAYRKKQEQAKAEQTRADWLRIQAGVEMLTDDQLEAAVFCVDPNDEDKLDVARYFLQVLHSRDEDRALDVFKRWKGLGA